MHGTPVDTLTEALRHERERVDSVVEAVNRLAQAEAGHPVELAPLEDRLAGLEASDRLRAQGLETVRAQLAAERARITTEQERLARRLGEHDHPTPPHQHGEVAGHEHPHEHGTVPQHEHPHEHTHTPQHEHPHEHTLVPSHEHPHEHTAIPQHEHAHEHRDYANAVHDHEGESHRLDGVAERTDRLALRFDQWHGEIAPQLAGLQGGVDHLAETLRIHNHPLAAHGHGELTEALRGLTDLAEQLTGRLATLEARTLRLEDWEAELADLAERLTAHSHPLMTHEHPVGEHHHVGDAEAISDTDMRHVHVFRTSERRADGVAVLRCDVPNCNAKFLMEAFGG